MMTERKAETREVDWLQEEYRDREAKEACMLALTSAIKIARECSLHPLSLEETQNLLETVWYELVQE